MNDKSNTSSTATTCLPAWLVMRRGGGRIKCSSTYNNPESKWAAHNSRAARHQPADGQRAWQLVG